ncbi:MAG: methyltransferase domain-containing protein [Roseovarius sp.]
MTRERDTAMESLETRVADHYAVDRIVDTIKKALEKAGADPEAPRPEDLRPVDEFHTGGQEATDALLNQLDITSETRVLDIGCGLGGTARHVAARAGCHVTGIDLTPDYIAAAKALSTLVGLDNLTTFKTGSALDLPVEDGTFDLVLMLHVGMNIDEKKGLFAEVARVLAPGGSFALFDVMRLSDAPLNFPFPWAETSGFSFVDPPEMYREAAEKAGLGQLAERNRLDFALDFFNRVFARMEKAGGPPPLGIHLLMGGTAKEKLQNYVTHISAGDIAPFEMIFRAPK